jgi:radical SAM superfamily enzyme YgiQ (UPF0313 family)
MRTIHRLNRRVSAKIVLGGPGAWQLAQNAAERQALGIDHVIVGYAENGVADVFRQLLQREPMPEVIAGDWEPAAPIPPIRGASTMGAVELSRGCGLGCSFCTIARVPMVHLPPKTILADVQTNLAAGLNSVSLLSEDFFRYGAEGIRAAPEALISLVRSIRQIPQVRVIQPDHANLVTIAQYDDRELEVLHGLLAGDHTRRSVWVNTGVETASDELLKRTGGGAKMPRGPSESWGQFASQQLRRLCRAGFFPMASLMIGLPGERDQDVQETLAWVQSLSGERISVFPLLYAPVDGGPPLDPRRLRAVHWSLIKACYRLNFRWIPRIYAADQAAAGVPLVKRAVLQLMGRGQVLQWKTLFAWHGWRAGG